MGCYTNVLGMLWCRHLSKRFGEFTAVDNVTFEIPAGTICALLGPNGAGKSTLLKMLTGLLEPTSGEASVLDKREIGVLPENLGLFDDLTIEEHLQLTGPIYGLSSFETRSRTEQLLSALGVQEGRRTFLSQCSHGMRKKTSLAMALLPNPRVLFLDEPFEGIDPVTAETIRLLLISIARRGVTVLLSSHILSLVDRLAEQIMMIRKGQLVWNSAISELPRGLEEHYFELVEAPLEQDLPWLGSQAS
jgi:ABC-2 type transport system ATP-binding protein